MRYRCGIVPICPICPPGPHLPFPRWVGLALSGEYSRGVASAWLRPWDGVTVRALLGRYHFHPQPTPMTSRTAIILGMWCSEWPRLRAARTGMRRLSSRVVLAFGALLGACGSGSGAVPCEAPEPCAIVEQSCQHALLAVTACERRDDAVPELPAVRVLTRAELRNELGTMAGASSATPVLIDTALRSLGLLPPKMDSMEVQIRARGRIDRSLLRRPERGDHGGIGSIWPERLPGR